MRKLAHKAPLKVVTFKTFGSGVQYIVYEPQSA